MNAVRMTLVALACLLVAAGASAKNEPTKKEASATSKTAAPSNGAADFDKLKNLAGEWISRSSTDQMDVTRHTYRVVSNGSAVMLMTEVPNEGPMITMFYMDGPRLMATHFCGAKNQPRYVAVNSPDPKAIVFKFKDATNLASPQDAHMSAVTFRFGDSDHHTQEWTFSENGKNQTERFELERSK